MYWPNCSVCQYMKKHQDFRAACLRSTYFDPNGRESLLSVCERWGYPIKMPNVYRHMQRHQIKDIERSERLAKVSGEPSKVWQRTAGNRGLEKKPVELTNTEEIIEAPVETRQRYEVGLDEFIEAGRDRLKHNEMAISAPNYISAIKVKADIERTTKDRRLEMLRSMFAGAAPKKVEDGQQNPNGD